MKGAAGEQSMQNGMRTIKSFTVDHLTLMPGLYVSRIDERGGCPVTTFDLRMTAPGREPVMEMGALHTLEHMGATYLRSVREDILYFGPMGCRTGFYLLMFGDLAPEEIRPLLIEMCGWIMAYEGPVPGARPDQCGNYREHDLPGARSLAEKYREVLIREQAG